MKYFKTLRGYLTRGKEEPDNLFFKYSAAIRIGGKSLDFQFMENQFNIKSSLQHSAGELIRGSVFEDDMWIYESTEAVSENLPLEHHLNHINEIFLPQVEYLRILISHQCTIQVYLDYFTNSDIGGVEIPINCLQIYQALDIPFGCGFNFIMPKI